MNFFKSVFSDSPNSPPTPTADQTPSPSEDSWSLGSLLKTLATKSESVIDTYRHDIEELHSGLRMETSIIREVASRAVKDLPASLEAGASVAQESLESVGQAIDDIGSTVWKSTARIILGQGDNHDLSDFESNSGSSKAKRASFDVKYSRFDVQLRGMQGDWHTYCSEPEDKVDYEEWRLNFWVFDEVRKEEINRVFRENEVVREAYNEIVPSRVDGETFWRRYFYRVDRLKKAEEARAMIVKRAISGEGEEDLSWDFDEEEDQARGSGGSAEVEEGKGVGKAEDFGGGKLEGKGAVEEAKGNVNGGDSCKNSDVSVVSSQSMLAEVEDLGWDEIEYTGSNDEGKGEAVGSTSARSSLDRVDLRKRLDAAEEEEDLSWDIEDEDDEPVKS